jgi:4-amino-4-deoxy-L-arabinose transferase-like glycosyltransferase
VNEPPPPDSAAAPRFDTTRLADLAVVALAVLWLARLAVFAGDAVFQSDECFHAWVSGWIAAHGRLPREIPGLYSGFAYFYPPLFHVLGAAWIRVFGVGTLPELNVVVTGVLLVAVWATARMLAGRDAARWAALLVMTSTGIAQYATRFYVEALSTLFAVAALAALVRLGRTERTRDAILLGVTTGVAWLAKPSALVLVALWVVLAPAAAWRGRRMLARGLVLATAVAIGVASPYWLRDWILFGSPLYPAGARDRHPLIDRLNQIRFSLTPADLAHQMFLSMGPWIVAAALVILVLGWRARAPRAILSGLALCLLLIVLSPLQPMVEPRHLNPAVAVLAVLGAAGLTFVVAGRPRLAAGIGILLMIGAGVAIATMQNPRDEFDPDPAVTEACVAVRRIVPAGETVLSLWTYDTFYHAGRDATWPVPWGQRDHPVEMFLTTDCDTVMAALVRHRIGWVLMPSNTAGAPVFDGANYPSSFVTCMNWLAGPGRVRVAWRSDEIELIQVRR